MLKVAVEVHAPVAKASFFIKFQLTGEELLDEEERPAEVEHVVQRIGDVTVATKFGSVK